MGSQTPRTLFITPTWGYDVEKLEAELKKLGLERLEPALALAPASLIVEGELWIYSTLEMDARTILRADFSGPIPGGRRAVLRVKGVSHVRASLPTRWSGETLPAGERPLPPRPEPPRTPAAPGGNRRHRRAAVLILGPAAGNESAVRSAAEALGIECDLRGEGGARGILATGERWRIKSYWDVPRYGASVLVSQLHVRCSVEQVENLLRLIPTLRRTK